MQRLAEAVGFGYKYNDDRGEYAHAAGIMVCTPEGRLSRYLFGIEYQAQDLKLALLEASRSGLPRVLRLDHREGAVLKPVYVEGQWTWSDGVSILFVSKVKVVGVAPTVTTEHERSAQAPWRIVLAPGGMNPGYRIDLRHRNGLSGIVRIDGRTGVEELRLAPDE